MKSKLVVVLALFATTKCDPALYDGAVYNIQPAYIVQRPFENSFRRSARNYDENSSGNYYGNTDLQSNVEYNKYEGPVYDYGSDNIAEARDNSNGYYTPSNDYSYKQKYGNPNNYYKYSSDSQSAKSEANVDEFGDSSSSSAYSTGGGTALSSSQARRDDSGHEKISSDAKTYSQQSASPILSDDSVVIDAKQFNTYLPSKNKVQSSSINYESADANSQRGSVYGQSFSSPKNTHRRKISWKFGTLYDNPASVSMNVQKQDVGDKTSDFSADKGYYSVKAESNFNQHAFDARKPTQNYPEHNQKATPQHQFAKHNVAVSNNAKDSSLNSDVSQASIDIRNSDYDTKKIPNQETSGQSSFVKSDSSNYGVVNVDSNTNSAGLGAAKSSAELKSNGQGVANSNIDYHNAGRVSAESQADTHGYAHSTVNSEDPASYGVAKATVESQNPNNRLVLPVVNDDFNSYPSSNGFGSLNANADVHKGYGAAKSHVNLQEGSYGSAKANANTNKYGQSFANSDATIQADKYDSKLYLPKNNFNNHAGSVDAYNYNKESIGDAGKLSTKQQNYADKWTNANENTKASSTLQSTEKAYNYNNNFNPYNSASQGIVSNSKGYTYNKPRVSFEDGYGNIKSTANSQGSGSAKANADISSAGRGAAKSSASSQGHGSASSSANIGSRFNSWRSAQNYNGGSKTFVDAQSSEHGTAFSNANAKRNNAGHWVANSEANSSGYGSAVANAQSS